VSRTQEKLDRLATELGEAGIDVAGFAADVTDRPSLAAASARIKDRFGGVDVLEYSSASAMSAEAMIAPLDATVDNIQPELDYYLHGGLTAAQQVLPDMIERDCGTLLFTTGGSSMASVLNFSNRSDAPAPLSPAREEQRDVQLR
jgi:NADP-dependent 3-hydroxy acid dehydrogenase YdfG